MRAAVLLAVLAAACAPRVVAQRPHPAPTADELMGVLRARHAALKTLNVETQTTSWFDGDRVRATVLMLVDRAGRLRFSAEVRLQGAVADLAVRGTEFALIEHEARVFRTGRACPQNVASLVRIPLHPEEIAAILLGDAPLAAAARPVGVTWDGRLRADVLEIASPAGRLWVAFRKAGAAVQIVAVEGQWPGARDRWRVEYDELERVGGHLLPQVVRFAEPGKSFDEGVEIKVKPEERRVNAPLPDEAFSVEPPPGFTVERMSCPGEARR